MGRIDFNDRKCVELCGRHGVTLSGGGEYRLDLCKQVVESGRVACCAPLIFNKRLMGRVMLEFGQNPPTTLNKELISLMAMADEAACYIPARLLHNPAKRKGYVPGPGARAATERRLELRCLGGFSLVKGGIPVTRASFAYRGKARTLLKFLILRGGKPVNKEALIDFLWPEADGRSAINRLHGVVHALRAAIDTDRCNKEWMYIRREGEGYYFNLDSPQFVDVFRFRQILDEALMSDRERPEQDTLAFLQEAIALYRGDLYENEFDAEHFEAEREYLRQLYVAAVRRLVEIRISRGELEQACSCLREALRIYAAEEGLHQGLIKLLLMQGKRREAFKQFDLCVEIVRRDLDAEPLPETLQLKSMMTQSS